MPLPLPAIDDVGQAIQLALTPAFLLTALAGLLFTAATLAMVTGLASFLREVQLAMLTIRIPPLPDDTR